MWIVVDLMGVKPHHHVYKQKTDILFLLNSIVLQYYSLNRCSALVSWKEQNVMTRPLLPTLKAYSLVHLILLTESMNENKAICSSIKQISPIASYRQ